MSRTEEVAQSSETLEHPVEDKTEEISEISKTPEAEQRNSGTSKAKLLRTASGLSSDDLSRSSKLPNSVSAVKSGESIVNEQPSTIPVVVVIPEKATSKKAPYSEEEPEVASRSQSSGSSSDLADSRIIDVGPVNADLNMVTKPSSLNGITPVHGNNKTETEPHIPPAEQITHAARTTTLAAAYIAAHTAKPPLIIPTSILESEAELAKSANSKKEKPAESAEFQHEADVVTAGRNFTKKTEAYAPAQTKSPMLEAPIENNAKTIPTDEHSKEATTHATGFRKDFDENLKKAVAAASRSGLAAGSIASDESAPQTFTRVSVGDKSQVKKPEGMFSTHF